MKTKSIFLSPKEDDYAKEEGKDKQSYHKRIHNLKALNRIKEIREGLDK